MRRLLPDQPLTDDDAGLADAYRRMRDAGVPVRQAADHGPHEAIYLSDPDGNDVELMWDRPPEQWPRDEAGHVTMAMDDALDLDPLVAEA